MPSSTTMSLCTTFSISHLTLADSLAPTITPLRRKYQEHIRGERHRHHRLNGVIKLARERCFEKLPSCARPEEARRSFTPAAIPCRKTQTQDRLTKTPALVLCVAALFAERRSLEISETHFDEELLRSLANLGSLSTEEKRVYSVSGRSSTLGVARWLYHYRW